MGAGRMDRRVTLKARGDARDDFGHKAGGLTVLAEVWAEYKQVSDGERFRAEQVGATATAWFRIRYSATVAAITPRDVIGYDGRDYEIAAVKEIGRRRYLEITAGAEVSDEAGS